jgi:hypothetical protein
VYSEVAEGFTNPAQRTAKLLKVEDKIISQLNGKLNLRSICTHGLPPKNQGRKLDYIKHMTMSCLDKDTPWREKIVKKGKERCD